MFWTRKPESPADLDKRPCGGVQVRRHTGQRPSHLFMKTRPPRLGMSAQRVQLPPAARQFAGREGGIERERDAGYVEGRDEEIDPTCIISTGSDGSDIWPSGSARGYGRRENGRD